MVIPLCKISLFSFPVFHLFSRYLVLPILTLPDQGIDRQLKRIGQALQQLLSILVHALQDPVAGIIYDGAAVKADNIADIPLRQPGIPGTVFYKGTDKIADNRISSCLDFARCSTALLCSRIMADAAL